MNFLRPEHASAKSARIKVEEVISGVPQETAKFVTKEETREVLDLTTPLKTEGGRLRMADSNETAPNLSHMGAAPGSNSNALVDDENSKSTPKREASWPPQDERETARRRQFDTPKTVALKERGLYSPVGKMKDLILENEKLKEEVRALKKSVEEKDEILAQWQESAKPFLQLIDLKRSGWAVWATEPTKQLWFHPQT